MRRFTTGGSALLALVVGGALLAGCPDDGGDAPRDTSVTDTSAPDTALGDTSAPPDGVDDTGGADSGGDTVVEDAGPGDTAEGDGFVPTEPGTFVAGTASLAQEYVFKGVWAGEDGRVVAVGNDGVVASRSAAGAWSVLTHAEGAQLLNAVHGADGEHLWAVGLNGSILPGTRDSFGESNSCTSAAQCDDGDSCTIDLCTNSVCEVRPTGGPGCCGTSPGGWDFESGALAPWTVTDVTGPLTWQVVDRRAASGAFSLYFGDPAQEPPSYDRGERVAATAVSPTARLPATGTVTLTFKVFLAAEADSSFDKLTLEVKRGATVSEVWSKAQLGTIPTSGFVPVAVDLSAFRGSTVTLRFKFDSVDGTVNAFEGAYLDDVLLTSTCTASGTANTQSGPTLWGVYAVATDRAYAVGQGGTILEWDGSAWSSGSSSDTTAVWNGMAGVGQNLALVGNAGRVAMSTGGPLASVTSGTSRNLQAVGTADGLVYWAVGDQGTVLRGEGTSWSPLTAPTAVNLTDVAVVGSSDVWMVGESGVVLHFGGGTWTTLAAPGSPNLLAVRVAPDGLVLVTGAEGVVLQGGLEGFTSVGTYNSGGDLRSLFALDGVKVAVGTSGRIVADRGAGWLFEDSGTSQTLEAVYGFAADDLWAVGRSGTALHWDGATWERVEVPISASLNALWSPGAPTLYAAGSGGALLAWTGAAWTPLTGSTRANLRAVFGRAAGDVWAVGAGATIMHNTGLGWAVIPVEKIPTEDGEGEAITDELHGVWAAAADDAWAVGANGRILHWDGATWSKYDTDWEITLRGVYGVAWDDIWAVGNAGQALHFNGREWERMETGSIATLHAISGDGAGHVVVVGTLGTVLTLER